MNNKIIFLMTCVLLLGLTLDSNAQMYRKSINKKKKYGQLEQDLTYIGIKGGVTMANFSYTKNEELTKLKQDYMLRPMYGAFIERSTKNASYGLELMYAGSGTYTEFPFHGLYTVKYEVKSNYFQIRVPLALKIPMSYYFKPYIFATPTIGFNLGGQITWLHETEFSSNNSNMQETNILEIGRGNMALATGSLVTGLGFNTKIRVGASHVLVKAEAGYHLGFVSTYSQREKNNESISENVNAYYIKGDRYNRGFEFSVGIALPLRSSMRGACINWGEY